MIDDDDDTRVTCSTESQSKNNLVATTKRFRDRKWTSKVALVFC